MVDGELIGKFRFIVLLTSMRHSEPVTDVTGVGIRFSKSITDCHNQSADWFRNDAFREGCAKNKQSDKYEFEVLENLGVVAYNRGK